LESLGYLVKAAVLNAVYYGVPQKRRRLFVVCLRNRRFTFPRPTHGAGHAPVVAVKDVLPPHQLGEPNPSKVVYAKNPDIRPNPYDGHVFNGGGRPINRDLPCHTILASAGGNKTHWFDDRGVVPAYHRHLATGGAPREGVVPGARRLTVLESQIIQTFPPSLIFSGPRSSQYEQVGNAVPPVLARALGVSLLEQMSSSGDQETAEPKQLDLLPA
jgi:DNA (cytosine-5)-methyltransferase 1